MFHVEHIVVTVPYVQEHMHKRRTHFGFKELAGKSQ